MKIYIPIIIGLSVLTIFSCNSSERIEMEATKKVGIACDHKSAVCTHGPVSNQKKQLKMPIDTSSKTKLIYYFDALCGWCYGFSPVMSKIQQTYGDQLDIEVISGGLFVGRRAGPINQVAPHIKQGAYKSVEARTGVKFGEVFLKDVFGEGKMTLNSLPATIALAIVKEEQPQEVVKFAGMLLSAVYYDGLDPIDLDGLAICAAKIGLDKEAFLVKLKDEKYLQVVEEEYQLFRSSKFSAMPAVVVVKGGEEYLISSGYAGFEDVVGRLESHLAVH